MDWIRHIVVGMMALIAGLMSPEAKEEIAPEPAAEVATASGEVRPSPTTGQTRESEVKSVPEREPVESGVEGEVLAWTLVLREGPGTAHAKLGTYGEGDRLTVVARALGSEWAKVEDQNGKEGWVSADIVWLKVEGGVDSLPVAKDPGSYEIKGRVVDIDGKPLWGMNLAVSSGGERTDANTDKEGMFYVYVPKDGDGAWSVSVVGYNCKSPVMDEFCKPKREFRDAGAIKSVSVPQQEEIEFVL